MRFVVQLQDLWQGRWLRMGAPATVEAPTALDAMNRVDQDSIGLRAGVTYRLHITGPTGEWVSDEVRAKAFPTTVRPVEPGSADGDRYPWVG